MATEAEPKSILVIGAGIIGLTTAIRLAEAGHEVAIVSQETPSTIFSDTDEDKSREKGTYTSSGSGGLWMPFLLEGERIEQWSRKSYVEYEKGNENIGITFHEGFFLNASEDNKQPWYSELTNMETITSNEDERIPKQYSNAFHFTAPVVNMELYLPYLEQRADTLGISITLTSEIDEEDDEENDDDGLWDMECVRTYTSPDTIIVVCTGIGSTLLCPNEKVIPGRGITVRIKKPDDKNYFITENPNDGFLSKDGLLAYAIPKGNHEYTLGGTNFTDDWREYGLEDEIEGVISRACNILQTDESNVEFTSTWTGLRPLTGDRTAKVGLVEENVIANFGHGGSGVTIAWGCADEICEIVNNMEQS